MAKKFYYQDKSKNNAKPVENGGEQKPKQPQNGKPKHKPQQKQAQTTKTTAVVQNIYPKEKMSLALENIGVSPKTAELLAKNKINTVGDVVVRSEKDMFKIQGFNKKMLFELRDGLKSQGMEFMPSEPKAPKQQPNAKQNKEVKDKLQGKADRKTDKAEKPAKAEKPEKLTEPLSVPDWRKIQKNGKWGFYDGFKTVIPAIYDEVFSFHDDLASVELEEKCGYIDKDNNIVIPLEYETAMSFSEGYAAVSKRDKFGYINKENTVVIPFEYDAATVFENGEAKVKKDGKWGTIFPDGTVKWI